MQGAAEASPRSVAAVSPASVAPGPRPRPLSELRRAADRSPRRPRDGSGRSAPRPSRNPPTAHDAGSPRRRKPSSSEGSGTAGRKRSTTSTGRNGSKRAPRDAAKGRGRSSRGGVLRGRPARGDLPERVCDRVEREQRRGVAGLVGAHRLEHREIGPFAVGRRTSAFSIFVIVSRRARSSSAVAPIACLAISEDDAWPSAQALTS